jgi:hypothetical protein
MKPRDYGLKKKKKRKKAVSVNARKLQAGWESHDSKANDDEGSPRLQPPANIRTPKPSLMLLLLLVLLLLGPEVLLGPEARPRLLLASTNPSSNGCPGVRK